jgi:hypothetical protein
VEKRLGPNGKAAVKDFGFHRRNISFALSLICTNQVPVPSLPASSVACMIMVNDDRTALAP